MNSKKAGKHHKRTTCPEPYVSSSTSFGYRYNKVTDPSNPVSSFTVDEWSSECTRCTCDSSQYLQCKHLQWIRIYQVPQYSACGNGMKSMDFSEYLMILKRGLTCDWDWNWGLYLDSGVLYVVLLGWLEDSTTRVSRAVQNSFTTLTTLVSTNCASESRVDPIWITLYVATEIRMVVISPSTVFRLTESKFNLMQVTFILMCFSKEIWLLFQCCQVLISLRPKVTREISGRSMKWFGMLQKISTDEYEQNKLLEDRAPPTGENDNFKRRRMYSSPSLSYPITPDHPWLIPQTKTVK